MLKKVERIPLSELAVTNTGMMRNLLSSSHKIEKGEKCGVLTKIMYLAPALEAGLTNCRHATPGCAAACLGHSAGRMPMGQGSRALKTLWFNEYREDFLRQLDLEIEMLRMHAARREMLLAIRANGSTDVYWEEHGVPQRHTQTQFYDYTKAPYEERDTSLPNYHLTFSLSERSDSWDRAQVWLEHGHNVAVVFRSAEDVQAAMVTGWRGREVINGDLHDIRFYDPKGVIVALTAKGKAKHDESGFVIDYSVEQALAAK